MAWSLGKVFGDNRSKMMMFDSMKRCAGILQKAAELQRLYSDGFRLHESTFFIVDQVTGGYLCGELAAGVEFLRRG